MSERRRATSRERTSRERTSSGERSGGEPTPSRESSEGFGTYDNHGVMFEIEGFKFILDKMAKECGVQVLYYTFFCDSIVQDGHVIGAVIQNKSGRQVVLAKRIIDCTGDGDAASHAC